MTHGLIFLTVFITALLVVLVLDAAMHKDNKL